MQIRLEVFAQVANRQTDRQTNNDDYISSLVEVNITRIFCGLLYCNVIVFYFPLYVHVHCINEYDENMKL